VSHEISGDPSGVAVERERHDGDSRQPWNDGYNATFINNTTTPQTYTITITCERMR
jgi:hypothetical protein